MSRKRVEPIKSTGKKKQELDKTISLINKFETQYTKELRVSNPNDDDERKRAETFFSNKTNELRREIKTYVKLGFTEEQALERVLPKAYASVKCASRFLWNKPHYDVQLIGGVLLNQGYASQMATGEGKTLTAALPAYLNALLGKGSQVITPNGYLAMRDEKEMSELYELMGLTCGLVEERGKISEDALEEKTIEILGPQLSKYIAGIKGEDEREVFIQTFLKDRKNSQVVYEARQKARTALQQEEILRRRKAYEADITYGSASAIAFDYLYDDIANNPEEMVQRPGLPNFAVVDEVDAVLFDDAVTPFSLSGTPKDDELTIPEEQKKESEKLIRLANMGIYRILSEEEKLKKRNSKDSLIFHTANEHDFELLVTDGAKQSDEYDMIKALIIDENTKQYHLTTLGETIVFQYYYAKDINRILLEHRDEIINMKFNGQPLFRENYEYTVTNGRIVMEPRAFAYLVTSGRIGELTETFEKFGLKELTKCHPQIDNALKSWFVLEENVDYKLSVPSNAKSKNERIVSLVMNGRTAEGRVYSNGLQQALEEKEKFLKRGRVDIRDTKIKSTLASIPTASFFARYDRIGGMTGTAAIEAFKELYGLETFEVPRNRPRQAVDRGDRLYKTSEAKDEAIFQEVLTSYQKGQPVLISTTSIEESIKLHDYLQQKFKELNYSVNIPVLNANVDRLEEEARIVSRAGLPKAITISTEMAGRGTDIKLGGEIPEMSDLIEQVGRERIAKVMEILKKNGNAPKNDDELRKMENEARRVVFKDKKNLEMAAKKRHELLVKYKSEDEEKVKSAGGLKVIGSGHFQYSRVDDQVKGRCGRQGNPGEIIFFNDEKDLLKVGVPKARVEELLAQTQSGPIVENTEKGYTPIGDLIYEAQYRTEAEVKESIKYNQEVEREVATFRKDFRTQRDSLKISGDYIDAVEYMIENASKSIILRSSEFDYPNFTDRTRVATSKINLDELASLSSEFLGVDIPPEALHSFKRVGDIKDYMVNLGSQSFQKRMSEVGREKFNDECKEIVDKLMNRSWNEFEEYVECIKHQRQLNGLVQLSEGGTIEAQIARSYTHCAESHIAMIVREVINPEYRTKYQDRARNELIPLRVTPHGVRKVEKDYDEKEQEHARQIEREEEERRAASNIRNLDPRPRVFTDINRAKLIKTSQKLRNVPPDYNNNDNDEVSSINFGDEYNGNAGLGHR